MKRFTILTLFLLVSIQAYVDAYAGIENDLQTTFKIEKMTCATCPIAVRKAMQRVDGVKEVIVDFDSKKATVIYDGKRTDAKQIAASSTNIGFPATPIEKNTR